MGNLLAVTIHKASFSDTKFGIYPALLAHSIYSTITTFSADGGYRKTFEEDIANILNLKVEISKKIKEEGFHLIPKRWIVERTFAWFNNSRRLSKDYEIEVNSAEAMVKISHIHTLLKRL